MIVGGCVVVRGDYFGLFGWPLAGQKYLFYLISVAQTFLNCAPNEPQLYKIRAIYLIVLLRYIFVVCIGLLYVTNYYAT